MLRLSRMTDYGVVVMSALAGAPEVVRSTQQISLETGLPQATVSKLLKALAKAGLVTSQRGAAGGYGLGGAAEAISVAAIIDCLEGETDLVACVDSIAGACEREGSCPIHGRWDPVNAAVRAALESVSLADMLSATAAAVPHFEADKAPDPRPSTASG